MEFQSDEEDEKNKINAQEYEQKRLNNINALKQLMENNFPVFGEESSSEMTVDEESRPPPKKRRLGTTKKSSILEQSDRPRRSNIPKVEYSQLLEEDNDWPDSWSPKPSKIRIKASSSYSASSSNEKSKKKGKRRIIPERKSFEDVTEAYISKVAIKRGRTTDFGTVCHQCRQRTDDSKTICFAKYCPGNRGNFCGTCLRNRYGENAKEALRNSEWRCPACRGICNCSICYTKDEKKATGILAPIAFRNGFQSVHHFLQNIAKEKNGGKRKERTLSSSECEI